MPTYLPRVARLVLCALMLGLLGTVEALASDPASQQIRDHQRALQQIEQHQRLQQWQRRGGSTAVSSRPRQPRLITGAGQSRVCTSPATNRSPAPTLNNTCGRCCHPARAWPISIVYSKPLPNSMYAPVIRPVDRTWPGNRRLASHSRWSSSKALSSRSGSPIPPCHVLTRRLSQPAGPAVVLA